MDSYSQFKRPMPSSGSYYRSLMSDMQDRGTYIHRSDVHPQPQPFDYTQHQIPASSAPMIDPFWPVGALFGHRRE